MTRTHDPGRTAAIVSAQKTAIGTGELHDHPPGSDGMDEGIA